MRVKSLYRHLVILKCLRLFSWPRLEDSECVSTTLCHHGWHFLLFFLIWNNIGKLAHPTHVCEVCALPCAPPINTSHLSLFLCFVVCLLPVFRFLPLLPRRDQLTRPRTARALDSSQQRAAASPRLGSPRSYAKWDHQRCVSPSSPAATVLLLH